MVIFIPELAELIMTALYDQIVQFWSFENIETRQLGKANSFLPPSQGYLTNQTGVTPHSFNRIL